MNPVDRSSLKNAWIAFEWGFDGRRTNSPRRMTSPAFATPPCKISSTRQVCQGLPRSLPVEGPSVSRSLCGVQALAIARRVARFSVRSPIGPT